jgi:Tfp pilus assembly protein PilF
MGVLSVSKLLVILLIIPRSLGVLHLLRLLERLGFTLLANTQLTPKEFETSFQIKLAMNMLNAENMLAAKENLLAALSIIHRDPNDWG